MANLARKIYEFPAVERALNFLDLDYHARALYFRLRELYRGADTITIGDVTVSFAKTAIPDSNYFDPELMVLEDLLSNVRSDDTVWDVGADKSLYTCPVQKSASAGNVVAFEPHPIRRGELERNLQRNDLTANIRTEALSDTQRTAEFSYRIEPDPDSEGEMRLSLQTGDRLIEGGVVPAPNVIKVDVEGAELDVLRGLDERLQQESCRLVYVELHGQIECFGGTWGELKDLLRNQGFSIEKIAERDGGDFKQPYLKAEKF